VPGAGDVDQPTPLPFVERLPLRDWTRVARLGDALRAQCSSADPSPDETAWRSIAEWQARRGGSIERPTWEGVTTLLLDGESRPFDAEVPGLGVDSSSAAHHPLYSLLSCEDFAEDAAFFAQPVAPLHAARLAAISRWMLPSARLSLAVPKLENGLDSSLAAAIALPRSSRERIIRAFAHKPIASDSEGADRRLISRSFHFGKQRPAWMGRSYELAPVDRRISCPGGQVVTMMDADVKGAGRNIPALRRDDPLLDGLLTLDEAQSEVFFGDLLFEAGARSSIGAYVLTSPELPQKQVQNEGRAPSALLVRFLREARRVGNLACYDLIRRHLVVRYCLEKLIANGELSAEATFREYLEWYCARMAENAARFARVGVLHCALHPQNLTLAAEVVDHGMTMLLPEARRNEESILLDCGHPMRPEETFRNQPGRMLVGVRYLRDQLLPLDPSVRSVDLTRGFVDCFRQSLSEHAALARLSIAADAFDLMEDAVWLFTPPIAS
jgi:hypothetical protein